MRAVTAAAALLLCVAAHAQEIDVFDQNDFIDPRDRGAVFDDARGWGVKDPGNPFYLVRLYGGHVSDYQWRSASTDADLSFVHAVGSFYRGDKQLNLKLTTFGADDDAKLPSYRGTVQLGHYFTRGEGARISNRILLTWAVEDNPYRGDPESNRQERFNHELGAEADVQIGNVDGAFIWMRRRISEGSSVDRVSYLYRFRERVRSNDRLRLNASVGFGAERAGGWHCCLARAVLTATFILPYIDTGLNVAWAPTYAPGAEGRRTHYELAFYLDRTAVAQIRDAVRPR